MPQTARIYSYYVEKWDEEELAYYIMTMKVKNFQKIDIYLTILF